MYDTTMTAANPGGGDDPDLSRERVLNFMYDADWPVTSKYVGDELGTSQQNAYYYLRQLRDAGEVERLKLSSNVVLWRPLSPR
ncbi:FaeA/PapI family transcriptional regulator [Haloglomus litoreum]|uniref:FaeA/PapI family transcriptional regulator n=1 Tax=Haloglomus litoreum TaxID=3034026 RepID=UPI003B223A65